jgi:GT2 family glycosyltransferase
MTGELPRFSFIIPTYNRAELLPAAVASILAQPSEDYEVIVVDDGSTDNTEAVLQDLRGGGMVQTIHQSNKGRSAARNHGAIIARGEFLSFLDSDDRQLPGALTAYARTLAGNREVGLTIGGYEYIDEIGKTIGWREPWTESNDLRLEDWLFNCFGVHGAFLVRRDWFERVQGYDPSLHMAEDWDLFLRLAEAGCPMGWTRAIVCQYRQHPGRSSRALALHRDSSLRVLDKVFSRPDLPPQLAGLAPQARAWVYVLFACKAISASDVQAATLDLQEALAIDPGLGDSRRLRLLESLYGFERLEPAAGVGEVTPMDAAVTASLPPALRRHPQAIRQARARAHMARFFRAAGRQANKQASSELRTALRLDPVWLLNRGVVAFCLRQLWRGSLLAAGHVDG